jgi:hypothetical protein
MFKRELTKTSGQNDGDDRSKFHGEATGRRHESDTVTQVTHNVVTVCPKTEDNTSTAKSENPERDLSLASGDLARVPDLVDGGIRANSVGNIVGTVDERGRGSSHDLEECVEELSAVVEVSGTSVDLLNITSNDRLLALRPNDILVDTVQDGELDGPPDESTRVPRSIGLGANHGLVLRVIVRGGLISSRVGSSLLVVASLEILSKGSSALSTALVKLLTGKMALIEVANNTLEVLGGGRDGAAAEEKRAKEDVVGLDLPILLDDNAVQPGDEEDGHEKTPTSTSSNNDTWDLLLSEVDLVRAALPDQKHDNERGGGPEVEGDEDETLDGRALAEEDTVLGEEEDCGTEDTGKHRGDDPSKEDLRVYMLVNLFDKNREI